MLQLAITCLIIALIAAILGFGGIAGSFVGVAKILFVALHGRATACHTMIEAAEIRCQLQPRRGLDSQANQDRRHCFRDRAAFPLDHLAARPVEYLATWSSWSSGFSR